MHDGGANQLSPWRLRILLAMFNVRYYIYIERELSIRIYHVRCDVYNTKYIYMCVAIEDDDDNNIRDRKCVLMSARGLRQFPISFRPPIVRCSAAART